MIISSSLTFHRALRIYWIGWLSIFVTVMVNLVKYLYLKIITYHFNGLSSPKIQGEIYKTNVVKLNM